MASNRSYLVVSVEHNYHVDGIKHSVYCSTEDEAVEIAKEWKKGKGKILVYKCIGEAEIEQVQKNTFKRI